MSKHTNHKTLKLGAYYAVLSVVVIAVVIAVNLLIGELPSTLTKFDTSGNQIYTLSEQSESIARNLKDEGADIFGLLCRVHNCKSFAPA